MRALVILSLSLVPYGAFAADMNAPSAGNFTVAEGEVFYTYQRYTGTSCYDYLSEEDDKLHRACDHNSDALFARTRLDGTPVDSTGSRVDVGAFLPWNNGRVIAFSADDGMAFRASRFFTAKGASTKVPAALNAIGYDDWASRLATSATSVSYADNVDDGAGRTTARINRIDYDGKVLSPPVTVSSVEYGFDLVGLAPVGDEVAVLWGRKTYDIRNEPHSSLNLTRIASDGTLFDATPIAIVDELADQGVQLIGSTPEGFALAFGSAPTALQFYAADGTPGARITTDADETKVHFAALADGYCEAWIANQVTLIDPTPSPLHARVRDGKGAVISGDAPLVLDANAIGFPSQLVSDGTTCYVDYTGSDGAVHLVAFDQAGARPAITLATNAAAGCAVGGSVSITLEGLVLAFVVTLLLRRRAPRRLIGLGVALLSIGVARADAPTTLSALVVVDGTAFYTYDNDGGHCTLLTPCDGERRVRSLVRVPVDGSLPSTPPIIGDLAGLLRWSDGRALSLSAGTDGLALSPHLAFGATGPGAPVASALGGAQIQGRSAPAVVRLPTSALYVSSPTGAGLVVNLIDYEGNVLAPATPVPQTDDVELVGLVPTGGGYAAALVWLDQTTTALHAVHLDTHGKVVEKDPGFLGLGDYYTLTMIGGTYQGFALYSVNGPSSRELQFYDSSFSPGALIKLDDGELSPYLAATATEYCEAWIELASVSFALKARVRDAQGDIASGDAPLLLDASTNHNGDSPNDVLVTSDGVSCYAAYQRGDGKFVLTTFDKTGVLFSTPLSTPGASGCAAAGSPPSAESLLLLISGLTMMARRARRVSRARP